MKYIFSLVALSIVGDILSKYLVATYLKNKIFLVGDFLYLETVKNSGVAFSFNISGLFLKVLTVVLIFGIIYYYIKEEKKKKNVLVDTAFGLVLGGAIGNAYERLFFGEVIDFVGVKYFAVFNFADACISVGFVIYLLSFIFRKK